MVRVRLIEGLALVLLALVACAGATPAATPFLPTATTAAVAPTAAVVSATPVPPSPTASPEPPAATPTPEPPTATATLEPTPAATPTATVPPTPDPNQGVGDVIYADPLDGSSNWYWTSGDDMVDFYISAGEKQLIAQAKQSGSWRFTISPDTLAIGDQQVRVSAHTRVCAPADEYGLLFRVSYGPDDSYRFYAFKLRCDGAASLALIQADTTAVLVDWTPAAAIKPGADADNVLLVWAAGDEMRFYVNGSYLFSAQDATLRQGFYGFYLADRTNGDMAVGWQNLEVRSAALP